MSSVNCQGTPQAISSSLAEVPRLVRSEVTKGTVPPELAADTAAILQRDLAGPLSQQGASAMPDLFRSRLGAAVAGAALRQAAREASDGGPPGSTTSDPLGLGLAGGWPSVGPAGPGGAGWAGPGAGQEQWPVSRAGYGGNGLSTDPSLRPVLGPAGGGGIFDPRRQDPSVPSGGSSGDAAAPRGRTSQQRPYTPISLTGGELDSYFNPGAGPFDDDTFVIAEWIGPNQNPLLLRPQLENAKALYYAVVSPAARYYKKLMYGDPNHRVRAARILFGIVPASVVRQVLRGGPTNRHLIGESVNFSINGVEDDRVVDDIERGNIRAELGTYAAVNGVHATLPFVINGALVSGLKLYSDTGVPGFVGYSFNTNGQAA